MYLPQKLLGNKLSGLVLLVSMVFKIVKIMKISTVEHLVYIRKLTWKRTSLHIPSDCSVCMKGNQCITFPAFILKLATVCLILDCHMVPETGGRFPSRHFLG